MGSEMCIRDRGHIYYWQQKEIELQLSTETTDKTNTMIWERIFKCDLNSLNHRGQPKQSQINIYTDGSKARNHAGAGIAIMKHGNLQHTESIKLNPNVTIFQAEAKAICEAALWFKLNRMELYACTHFYRLTGHSPSIAQPPHHIKTHRRHNISTKPTRENS